MRESEEKSMSDQLPPLSSTISPETCEIAHLYLAVERDLTPSQQQMLHDHLRTCATCRQEQAAIQQADMLLANWHSPEPSSALDQVILQQIQSPETLPKRASVPSRRLALLAAVAILLVVLSGGFFIWQLVAPPAPTALELPEQLRWNTYVLYSTKTLQNSQGETYQVRTYYDFREQRSRQEFVQPGKLDVVILRDGEQTLGLDLIHHLVQQDVHDWPQIDMSSFDLDQLRHDLATGKAVYQRKESYHNQDVYAIHTPQNTTLLLDMHFMPVNVMEEQTQGMMYDELEWLPPLSVPGNIWDMRIPEQFSPGTLPPVP
jgi:hypothetical protein